MQRFLTSKINIIGINKQNILFIIVFITILIAIILNIYSENKGDNTNKVTEIKNTNTSIKNEDVDAVLKDIDSNTLKETTTLVPKDVSTLNYNPINTNISTVAVNNMNKIYSSKMLMYSKPSNELNQAGSTVTNTKENNGYLLKAGSVIPALMINGINSDIAGDVIAIVRDNIYDSINREYVLIPQGAKLVGKYDANILFAQDRLAVFWSQLIYPNGNTINLDGLKGSDLSGYSGFYDQVDNHYLRIFGASFVMGVITGAMQYSQTSNNNNQSLNAGQVMSNSLGQQMGQTSLMLTNKNINVKPTIIIRPNYPFNIMLVSDLSLSPYY